MAKKTEKYCSRPAAAALAHVAQECTNVSSAVQITQLYGFHSMALSGEKNANEIRRRIGDLRWALDRLERQLPYTD